ncbi:MAG: hypothetical protein ACLT5T_08740 [Segatella copri]|jgi:hypothetical protein
MKQTINVSNKAEVKAVVTNALTGNFNYFQGDIRKGNRTAHVNYLFFGSSIYILVTYSENGESVAEDTVSYCYTAKSVTTKVSEFLNVK